MSYLPILYPIVYKWSTNAKMLMTFNKYDVRAQWAKSPKSSVGVYF